MIKKTIRKAAVGTVTAGALMLPMAAGTVAPQLQLVDCKYPRSVSTATDAVVQDPVVRPHRGVHIDAIVSTEGNVDPNGTLELRVTRPNGTRYATKSKSVGDGTRAFVIKAPGVRGNKEKTMKVVILFRGGCKFRNSSGVAYFVVSR